MHCSLASAKITSCHDRPMTGLDSLSGGIEAALGDAVLELSPIAGGDINRAYRGRLRCGESVFVKTHDAPPTGMYLREAEGLQFITCDDGPRIPRVRWAGDRGDAAKGAPAMLVLELIEGGPPGRDHDERLGRGLAAIHAARCERFGLPRDNFIGSLPQNNQRTDDWAQFYTERRLSPLLSRAVDAGHVPVTMVAQFERLLGRMDQHVGDPEPPSRLHGDLWGGNAMVDGAGQPVLIDPAVYGGHREVDLAMMRLFGGFSARCFAAYAEAYPLQSGHEQRVALYQLYPLLVHVNLFGGSYLGSLRRALAQLV